MQQRPARMQPSWWGVLEAIGLRGVGALPQARRRGCPGRGTPGERGNGPSRGVPRARIQARIY